MILTAGMALADSVYVEVCQYTSCDDGEPQLIDETFCEAGGMYLTEPAPEIDGYIFTNWEISTDDPIVARDFWSRALDEAVFMPYQDVALIARYVSESEDSDGDGIPDGYELYWYGDLEVSHDSDTDHDGFTFAEEIANGTNPHFANSRQHGRIRKGKSGFIQINPYNSAGFIIRSDDGALLEETTNYVSVGGLATTPALSPATSAFAYWTVNGEPARDAFGRAFDRVSVPMSDVELVIEARTVSDETDRFKLYWYGTTDVELDGDTDGDGYTFAEEIANGTNPHFADAKAFGRIRKYMGEKVLLNPTGLSGYILRSEGGDLVSTSTNYAAIGEAILSPSFSPVDSAFAYWRVNGEPARDAFGRAMDRVETSMSDAVLEIVAVAESDETARQKLYWYGMTDVELDSDTDGDGYTFAEEIANGTNPHFPDSHQRGSVKKVLGEAVDVNGQIYEKVDGVVLDGEYVRLFDSDGDSQSSESVVFADEFGNPTAVWPVVCDITGDGLWDLVVVSESATNVYVNVGSKGNPEFEARGGLIEAALPWCDMNSTAKLSSMSLDIAPVGAHSATTNGTTLLVSDEDGRIWYYQKVAQERDPSEFALQHKVWGGSYAGFANGLRLAAVDWDDDGDLDCLCGTAEGKLMLLRDPKVGRPSNLKAQAGVDNVVLTWDPNAQSRIRGYKVYRGLAEGELGNLAQIPLPSYRDEPSVLQPYDYAVSSVSRFYTAGNSTPTVNESPMTASVRVEFGKVEFAWNDAVGSIGGQVMVTLSIGNTMNLSTNGLALAIGYDTAVLRLLKTVPSALMDSAKMPAGSGKLIDYVFEVIAAEPGVTEVSLTSATVFAINGSAVTPVMPTANAVVTISASANPPYALGDMDGNGVIDVKDLRLLAKLKNGNGRKCTANQLKAGDFNGNGKLDNADYQSLRSLLREKGVL